MNTAASIVNRISG